MQRSSMEDLSKRSRGHSPDAWQDEKLPPGMCHPSFHCSALELALSGTWEQSHIPALTKLMVYCRKTAINKRDSRWGETLRKKSVTVSGLRMARKAMNWLLWRNQHLEKLALQRICAEP